jgi:hypothetical protein
MVLSQQLQQVCFVCTAKRALLDAEGWEPWLPTSITGARVAAAPHGKIIVAERLPQTNEQRVRTNRELRHKCCKIYTSKSKLFRYANNTAFYLQTAGTRNATKNQENIIGGVGSSMWGTFLALPPKPYGIGMFLVLLKHRSKKTNFPS